jgi:hypothetical protein
VNVRELTKAVYVDPFAPPFLFEAVRAVMDAFGYSDLPVERSSLAVEPFKV